MTKIPLKRGTILIPSGTNNDLGKKHLFVICSDVCDKGLLVLVPLSSFTNDLCDQTCLLNSGEHPFLVRKSYVLYRKSEIYSASGLVDAVSQGLFSQREDINGQTFLRIKNGFCKSIQTPRKVKIYLNCENLA